MDENSFDNLVKDISVEERKDLSEKIGESLSLSEPVIPKAFYCDKAIVSNTSQAAEINRFLRQEYAKFRFFKRLAIGFQVTFLKKDKQLMIMQAVLDNLRRHIEEGGYFVDFDSNNFTAKFAKELYQLSNLCRPLRAAFIKIWRDNATLNLVLSNFLQSSKEESLNRFTVYTFATNEQLLEAYSKSNDINDVRKVILRGIKNYTDSIPESHFKTIRKNILPFYYVQRLITFNYNDIFALFGTKVSGINENEHPHFNPAPISMAFNNVIKFNYYLVMATNLQFTKEIASTLFRAYFVSEGYPEDELHTLIEEKIKQLDTLSKGIAKFNGRVYLNDIIAYYQSNPLYKTVIEPVRLDLKQFYNNSLKLMVFDNFNDIIQELRLAFIDQEVVTIFKNKPLTTLNYYVSLNDENWPKDKYPQFKHGKSLMLMYNFLKDWYKSNLLIVTNLISATVLAKAPALQGKINEFKIKFSAVEDKIKRFDNSLAPETEAGQSLTTFKRDINEGTASPKLFRAFINQRDTEAYELFLEALAIFDEFSRFTVAKVTKSPTESVRMALTGFYAGLSREFPLGEVINNNLTTINNFTQMCKELIAYESIDEKAS
ncbi:MAG: DUF5312 domain-containing protein [Spirochaetaceae bacterium]|nr:DUF5312 domain-containing protein [Spirochaetaceae bacterium]